MPTVPADALGSHTHLPCPTPALISQTRTVTLGGQLLLRCRFVLFVSCVREAIETESTSTAAMFSPFTGESKGGGRPNSRFPPSPDGY